MKKSKKIICLLSTLALTLTMGLSLTSCGGESESADKETTLVAATAVVKSHPYYMSLEWMQEYLESVDSTVKLDLYDSGTLGGEVELANHAILNDGDVDIIAIADLSLSTHIPEQAFMNFPGMFKDYDDVKEKLLNGWIGEKFDKMLDENNLVRLGYMDNDFSWVSCDTHEIKSLKDVKGLKLRVPEVECMVDFWEKVGAVPCVVPLGDLVSSLQQGVIDGQELGINCFYNYDIQSYQKYFTPINYCYKSGVLIMNKDVISGLSEQQQKDLKAAGEYAEEKCFEYTLNEFQPSAMEDLKTNGENVITPMTDGFHKEIVKVGRDLAYTDKWMKILGEDLVKKMYGDK